MPLKDVPQTAQGASAAEGAAAPVAHRNPAARAGILLCVAALAAALVAGAAAVRPPDADATTLRGFQVRVLSISQAVAENRTDGALAALQGLEKDLNDAAATGRLSAARYRGIASALEAVRADLATQVAAAAPVAEAGAPAPAQAADTSPQEPQPQEAAVPAVAPAPAQAPAESSDPGSSLPGKAKEDKGKGRGQGKP